MTIRYEKIEPRLYVRTSDNGMQTWVYRYTLAGLTREKSLGSVTGLRGGKVTKAEAIKQWKQHEAVFALGRDPFATIAGKQLTFAEVAGQCIEIGVRKWRVDARGVCRTEQDWNRMLKDCAKLARLRFNHPSIEDEVELALKPYWGAKNGEDYRSRIAVVFERAKLRKLWVGDNPANYARIVGLLGEGRDSRTEDKGGDVQSHKMLPHDEVAGVLALLAGHKGVAAAALRFLILTAARTANVVHCRKADIDRAARTWTVSGQGVTGEAMKSGASHTYYLNDQAMQIVDAMWDRAGDHLFANDQGKPLNDGALRDKLGPKRKGGLELQERASVHGFRATFGSWVKLRLTNLSDVADAMLAHAEGKVRAVYLRGDAVEKMRAVSQAWGNYCAGIDNVVTLKLAA